MSLICLASFCVRGAFVCPNWCSRLVLVLVFRFGTGFGHSVRAAVSIHLFLWPAPLVGRPSRNFAKTCEVRVVSTPCLNIDTRIPSVKIGRTGRVGGSKWSPPAAIGRPKGAHRNIFRRMGGWWGWWCVRGGGFLGGAKQKVPIFSVCEACPVYSFRKFPL